MINTLMTCGVVAVSPGTSLIEALRVMNSVEVRHLPVVDNDRCVGLLAEVDMLRQLVSHGLVRPESITRLTVGTVCHRPAPVVPVWATRSTAAQAMLASGSDAVLVLDDERLLGIVTASDLTASLAEHVSSSRQHAEQPRSPQQPACPLAAPPREEAPAR